MTWLYGVAVIFSEIKQQEGLEGNLKLIFQPNEERSVDQTVAALNIINSGLFQDIDALMELHPYAKLPIGEVLTTPNMMNVGSGRYKITIKGPGGHAAWKTQPNPNIAAAMITMILSDYSSEDSNSFINPSFTTSSENPAYNTIAKELILYGTIRIKVDDYASYTRELDSIKSFFKSLPTKIESNLDGIDLDIQYMDGTPPNYNHPELVKIADEVCNDLSLITKKDQIPGGSDIGFCTLNTKTPCFFGLLGSSNQEMIAKGINHHSPYFDVDQSVIASGALFMANFVSKYLNRGKK